MRRDRRRGQAIRRGHLLRGRDNEHHGSNGYRIAELVDQVGVDDEHLRAAVAQDVAGLVLPVVPVDRHRDRAKHLRRIGGLDERKVVAQHHRHAVALADACRREHAHTAQRTRLDLIGRAVTPARHEPQDRARIGLVIPQRRTRPAASAATLPPSFVQRSASMRASRAPPAITLSVVCGPSSDAHRVPQRQHVSS
jgi:hypothetical protein